MNIYSWPNVHFWLQAILIWLLSFPWFGKWGCLLVLTSSIAFYFPRLRSQASVVFALIAAALGWGPYRYISGASMWGQFVAVVSLVSFVLIIHYYLRLRPKHPMTHFFIVITFLILLFLLPGVFSRNHFIYGLIVMFTATFFVIIKEADQGSNDKSLLDHALSFCAPWNFPTLIAYTSAELRAVAVRSREEFLLNQRSAIKLLLRIAPLAFLLDSTFLIITSDLLENVPWLNLFKLNYRSDIFEILSTKVIFSEPGYTYLFALVFGGLCYIVGLIYMTAASVACANLFGYKLDYLNDLNFFRDFKTLIRSIYLYYSRAILHVFQTRLIKLLSNSKIKFSRSFRRAFYLYLTILLGGIIWNVMNDISKRLYITGIEKVFYVIPMETPYYLLLATIIFLAGKEIQVKHERSLFKKIVIGISSILLLCFLFSLRRLLLLNVGWSEYFRIIYEIFKSLVQIIF